MTSNKGSAKVIHVNCSKHLKNKSKNTSTLMDNVLDLPSI